MIIEKNKDSTNKIEETMVKILGEKQNFQKEREQLDEAFKKEEAEQGEFQTLLHQIQSSIRKIEE